MEDTIDQGESTALTVIGTRRRRSREPRVEPRDFRRPARPTGAQLRELEGFTARFAAHLRATIANRLKTPIETEPGSPDITVYSDAIEQMPAESWLLPLITDQGDAAALELDVELQRHFVVRFLGGDAAVAHDEDEEADADGMDVADEAPLDEEAAKKRDLPIGLISRAALAPLVRSILKDLGTFLREEASESAGEEEELYKLDADRVHTPQRRWMRAQEAVTILRFSIRENGEGGSLSLILPSSAMTRFIRVDESMLALPPSDPDSGARRHLESMVRDLGMGLSLRLGGATIDLAEFLRLGEGDVLVLDRRVGEPLDVNVGTERRFIGQPGRSRGRLAVRIIGPCDQKEDS